ncbi:hypothetical protein [Polyangium mundeleinium]|uniref:PE-PGRS family protein n=1 Tax=Polyangium mundeleinium TaxID=2995306 RepID=A0ABT5F5G3_9BACT|nr:hypothetical protein [Polyangium mundeleinium]MDC0749330.1 hypothetical protein [Polyangium mundeleinium]
MDHRLGFVSIAIVSLGLAACGLGNYEPPSGNGGEGGDDTGEGGSAGQGGSSSSSGGTGGGNGGTGGVGGGQGGSNAGSGGNSGAGGGPIPCEGVGPTCAQTCQSGGIVDPLCVSGKWECPPGTIDMSTCPGVDGCCTKESDCPITNTCAANRCKEKVPLPKCWADVDCVGGTCVGASVCPCNQTCFSPDTPGECKL